MCDLRKALRRPTWRTLRVLNAFVVALLGIRLVTVATIVQQQGPALAPFAWCCASAAVATGAVLGLLWVNSPRRAIAPARAVVGGGIHIVAMVLELAVASALRIPSLAVVGLVAFYAAVVTGMYLSVALAQELAARDRVSAMGSASGPSDESFGWQGVLDSFAQFVLLLTPGAGHVLAAQRMARARKRA